MTKRFRKLLRRLGIGLGLLPVLLGCQPSDACSPLATAAIDSACAEAVVQVVERECPEARTLAGCPEAELALAACDLVIAGHAERCSR